MADRTWIVMPIAGAQDYTETAIADCLAQSVPVRLLLVNQGVEAPFRQRLERIAESHEEEVLLWSHDPPLPSLAASWNRALQCVWEAGGTEALVVNNDVRLDARTVSILQAVLTWPKKANLFVSAVGVTATQFEARPDPLFSLPDEDPVTDATYDAIPKGGPDFSCFLISKAAHEKYPFDEGFVPAYAEDCDTHRRYMLGGDGDKIFSVNLPYLHYASGTLKSLDAEARGRLERRIDGSRAYYERKWGGGVNHETFTIPFDRETAQAGVTTPDLQRAIQGCADKTAGV